jgi:hypothetical protein
VAFRSASSAGLGAGIDPGASINLFLDHSGGRTPDQSLGKTKSFARRQPHRLVADNERQIICDNDLR